MIPIPPDIDLKGFRLMVAGACGICFFVGFMAHFVIAMFEEKPPVFTRAMCPKPTVAEPVACVSPHPKSALDIGARIKYVGSHVEIIPAGAEGTIVEGLGSCRVNISGKEDDDHIGFTVKLDITAENLCFQLSELRPI